LGDAEIYLLNLAPLRLGEVLELVKDVGDSLGHVAKIEGPRRLGKPSSASSTAPKSIAISNHGGVWPM